MEYNTRLIKILFVVILAILSSCRSTKNLTQNIPSASEKPLKPLSTYRLMKNVKNAESDYDTYGAKKASITAFIKGDKTSFSGSFKSKKDSAIIITAQKGIFPVGKMLATEDTLIMVNLLAGQTISSNYNRASELIGVQVSLNKLENLFLGNPLTFQVNSRSRILRKYKSCVEDGYYVLTSIKHNLVKKEKYSKRGQKIIFRKESKVYAGDNMVEEKLYFDPHTFKLKKMVYNNFSDHTKTLLNVDKYIELNGELYPSVVTLISQKEDTKVLELKVKLYKMWIDKKSSFRFSIPSSYKNKVL